jgi:hypothetical protein
MFVEIGLLSFVYNIGMYLLSAAIVNGKAGPTEALAQV